MAAKDADIRSFVIQAAKDEGRGVDIKEGMSSFAFYENIMSNHLTALVKVTDSGNSCLLYTSPSPRDQRGSRMPSSA